MAENKPQLAAPDQRLALRLLCGSAEGVELTLRDPERLVIGRAAEADLVLTAGMVSRRHALLVLEGGRLHLEDLGSTNGTYVNGRRVRTQQLLVGDRVLIGDNIMRVVWSQSGGSSSHETSEPSGPRALGGGPEGPVASSGQLELVAPLELLELFGGSDKTVTVALESGAARGQIALRGGLVEDAALDALPDAPARKCLLRMLGWTKGRFTLRPYAPTAGEGLGLVVAELLVQSRFQLDELTATAGRLPEPRAPLALARPLGAPLRELDELELDVLQLAHNLGCVAAVLDRSPEPDVDVARRLLGLLDRGYLRRG
ncbi:MAG: FHA domain-containing protein [Deltaproteobacteria bacterium]|nr:FHA domain-containing protein [Deltaproteobacteria bacterium]